MTSPTDSSLQDDPRVMQIAREFLAELEAGRSPDRNGFLARCPELGNALADCLDGIVLAHGAGQRLLPAPPQQQPEVHGTLGDFLIVSEIGRGGMGVVYEAIQISLNRMVALKVLPFAAALDERQLQRFRNEALAAAGLHHSHIVPVYAVGCERGVHFYAMQLIDGRPLDAVIREMRGVDAPAPLGESTVDLKHGQPTMIAPVSARPSLRSMRDRASYRTAARLAADVAEALEYAHRAGIVHRDIKPANLLLDSKGNVWVADFGLAHVNDASLTRTGDVVGTLRYMSPEQANGSRVLVDHRADVYSLGATLYEMLALEPIFSGQDRGALLNQILNEEPRPPRQVDRSIPADLETIVLKAIAKDPSDRYSSAAEMADDLQRFLGEMPILARRPSLPERARKWLRRHPWFVGGTVLLLTCISAVLAVAVALVSREQTRTRDAYAAEQKRAKEAEVRFRLAERAVDDLIQVAQEELRDNPAAENLRKQLMQLALAYHQEFIELHKDDPDAQVRLATNRDRVEAILNDLIDKEGARRADLLKDRAVLDDLKLSHEQRAEVEALNKRLHKTRSDTFKEFHKLTPDERERRFVEMARAQESAVAEVLSQEHVNRLRQIELQRQGAEAFRRPEVAAALKLTGAQKAQIRSAIADPYKGKPEPGGPPWMASEKKRKTSLEQVVTLLKPDQVARWKELIGEPFRGSGPPRDRGWPKGKRGTDGKP